MPPRGDYRRIGKIARPHGLKGDFYIDLESDFPEWLTGRPFYYLERPTGIERLAVERARLHKNRLLVKLLGIDTQDQAIAVRDTTLFLPEEEARTATDDPDYFYNSDLVGMALTGPQGAPVYGVIRKVIENPGHNLLEVEGSGGTSFLFPFVKALVEEIDTAAGQIRVNMPDGLMECNEPEMKT